MAASIVSSNVSINLTIGQTVRCKYPRRGNTNILANREGTIVKNGIGKAGTFVTLQLTDGSYRTLSTCRMVDAVNA